MKKWMPLVWGALSGLLFALGLVVSGMTQPAKVLAFLDLGALRGGINWFGQPGYWDPSLMAVMGSALGITLLAFARTGRRGKPWAAEGFHLPARRDLDRRLVVGSALFGIGWGLAGYCPGPALATLLVGGEDAWVFGTAMLLGLIGTRWWLLRHPR